MSKNYGLVHIYCGDGKGKTTAATGLAVRAAGAGARVCFSQFMKTGTSSELNILEKIDGIDLKLAKNEFGFTWKMTEEQKKELCKINNKLLEQIINDISVKKYDMIIIDEVMSAYNNGLIDKQKVLYLLDNHEDTEIVLTGRNPEDELIKRADYVSEIKAISHPMEKGIVGRVGIEY